MDRELLLGTEPQRGPTRDDDAQPAAGFEQLADERRGLEDMLERVENQKDVPIAEEAGEAVAG
jgi:hypothetical protein